MKMYDLRCWFGLCAFIVLMPQGSFSQTKPDQEHVPKDHSSTQLKLKPPPCNSYSMQEALTLSVHQKFCFYAENRVLTGSALFGSLFFSGVAQLRHDPKEWGQGAKGYSQRFGTRYAQGLAKSTAEFLVGAINHEDPRPHPPPNPNATKFHNHQPSTIKGRIGAALLHTVWTHRDNGTDGIAFSRVAGALSSGFIGNAWYPDRLSTVRQGFARTGSAMGGYVMSSLFTEFQPEIFGLVKRLLGMGPPAMPRRSRP